MRRSCLRVPSSLITAAALAGSFTIIGCRSKSADVEAVDPPAARPSIATTGSRFAGLRKGMSMKEVADRIGDPTGSDGHVMGKAFNPFYFGKDRYRRTWYYAGEGRLIFNVSARLLKVIYDPSEVGHPPT
jgi:hypothetical protein